MAYRPPAKEMAFILGEIAGLNKLVESGAYPDATPDLVEAVLEEAAKLSADVIAPLAGASDLTHPTLSDGAVTSSPGFVKAYQKWVEGGWGSIAAAPEHGGQGLPVGLSSTLLEMWNGASLAFGLCPTLSQGTIEAISAHGTDEQKATYLPKLISGEWTGTMNLTEPQAGSDLNALKAKAEPLGDGTYKISGTKIFITWGDHDMGENIVHLVLARLPDAPAGTRGISLFIVPKFMINDDGSLGARNDAQCIGLEHKLGIHGSPTCVMSFGEKEGAVGYLIGQENRGLACMFTMMNSARLLVGLQGVGLAERAYQHALDYTRERKQGRAPGSTAPAGEMDPIIAHPDVRRMLMTMRSKINAARAICYTTAVATDVAHGGMTPEAREAGKARADLLTPIAKSWSTDMGVEVASLGVQIHGGMGFVEETGAAQFYRDVRITPIYEGTNGIQAIDLVGRKLPLGGGDVVKAYIQELQDMANEARGENDPAFVKLADALDGALEDLKAGTDWMLTNMKAGEQKECLAGAMPYLNLFGTVAGGAYLVHTATVKRRGDAANSKTSLGLANFFAQNHLPETKGLLSAATAGAASLFELDADALAG